MQLTTKIRNIKLQLSAFLSVCLFASHVVAQTEITQEMVDAAQLKIDEACPVRWQNVSKKLVIPTDASESVWEDATDRTSFVNYITTVIADSGATADPQILTDDVATVAAECASKRTGLLDLLLIKEPNDVILGMRALKNILDEQGAFSRDGSIQSLAAKSCKAIKEGYSDSEDGIYWLDFDGGSTNNAVEVYCDMTTDGGGWTFIAFLSSEQNLDDGRGNFFHEPVGVYEPSRIVKSEHYSLGVLPKLDDTEMIIVRNSPEVDEANTSMNSGVGGLLWLKYSATSPGFNYGPIPCSNSSYSFKRNLTESFYSSYLLYCTEHYWYTAAPDNWYGGDWGERYMFLLGRSDKGMILGKKVAQSNNHSYYNKAWIYVR